jgi:glucose-1-phosphate cytidylyltransferase
MKAVILAGGLGTRLSEETYLKPKPMVEIGGKPILWHIMKIYSSHGVKDFIICLGYKGYKIKEFFSNYFMHMSDITFSLKDNTMKFHNSNAEDWEVTLVETGEATQTGGRLKRVQSYLEGESEFFFTYGDGVADIDVKSLLRFHKSHGKLATVTATIPASRYGALNLEPATGTVLSFREKPEEGSSWVNGGFFVLKNEVFKTLKDDTTVWEAEPLAALSKEGELVAFRHSGFWQPMDTVREKVILNQLWEQSKAPWKTWQ